MAIPTFIFRLPFLMRFFFLDAKSKSGVVTRRTDSDESEENCLIGVKPHPETSPEKEERNSAEKKEKESQIEKPFSVRRKSSNSSSSSSSKGGHSSSSSISEVQDEKSDDDQQKRKEFDALRTSPSSSSSSFSSLSSRGEKGTEEKQIKVIEDTKLLNPDCTQVEVQTAFDTTPDWKADLLTKGFDQANIFMPTKKESVIKVNEDKGSRKSSSSSTSSSNSNSRPYFIEFYSDCLCACVSCDDFFDHSYIGMCLVSAHIDCQFTIGPARPKDPGKDQKGPKHYYVSSDRIICLHF